MIYREANQWALCPLEVTYEQNGKQLTAYTHDKQWWQNFADKWEHTRIVNFTKAEHPQIYFERLEKVKYMGEGHGEAVKRYVETGEFPDEYDLAQLLHDGKVKPDMIPEEYQSNKGEVNA